MKAKPTLYKGIPFRSRLEARWAAFFDVLGWQWEYEPIDFNGWFPDFVIFGKRPIYVEVKPVIEFPEKVAEKMVRSVPLPFEDEIIIVGQRPLRSRHERDKNIYLGWSLNNGVPFDRSFSSRDLCPFGRWKGTEVKFHASPYKDGTIGFCSSEQSFKDMITGGYDGGSYGEGHLDPSEVLEKWGEAHKIVRFEKA